MAAVAAVNKKTVVVIHSVGPLILETILAQPNVVAVVWAGIPGQESGNGLVDVLYGSTSPSGKLPYTIAQAANDYASEPVSGDDSYSEGLYIDYRHFDHADIAPRYEFGFGLCTYSTCLIIIRAFRIELPELFTDVFPAYTNFTYSALSLPSPPASGTVPFSSLYNPAGTVTATISNSGGVTGAEAAQLYIGLPSSAPASPPKQLRGFDKLSLTPGASGTASFALRMKDLAYWNVASQQWTVPSGAFSVWVGASSRDLRLTGTLTVK